MQKHKHFFRFAFILSIILSIFLCPLQGWFNYSSTPVSAGGNLQVTFEPQITPIDYHTLSPEEITTAVYEMGPIKYEKDAFYSPTYRWVSCGGDPKHAGYVCYEICYGGNCFFVSDSDGRVGLYVSLVEEREKKIDELEELNRIRWPDVLKAGGDCLKAAGGGILIYTFYFAAASPEPTSKGIATLITAIGGGIICGGSLYNAFFPEGEKDEITKDIDAATITAIDVFLDIEKYSSE